MKLGPRSIPAALALFATLAAPASLPAAASGPFANQDGRWSGSGTITLSSGTRESIRCRAQNLVTDDGHNLQQALRCASDSYKFEINAYVDHEDGSISGYWGELTNNVDGSLKGSLKGRRIDATLRSIGFTASFRLDSSATSQSVLIKPDTEHTDITEVRINLRKR